MANPQKFFVDNKLFLCSVTPSFLKNLYFMKLSLNLGVGIFSRGFELFLGVRAGIWGWGGGLNPSMLTMILTIIINNTFELLI